MSQETPAGTAAESEVEPLQDEVLEEVSGGVCSLAHCSGGAVDNP